MPKMLAPEITNWPADQPTLIGSQCADCGATMFPVQERCGRCNSGSVSDILLPREGTLVAWTSQGFLPGRPYKGDEPADAFTPFLWGLVQLGDVIKVEGRLTETDPDRIKIGMPVETVMRRLFTDADGDDVLMFAFAPAGTEGGQS